eukprot:1327105-Prymnesium_polylepis.1
MPHTQDLARSHALLETTTPPIVVAKTWWFHCLCQLRWPMVRREAVPSATRALRTAVPLARARRPVRDQSATTDTGYDNTGENAEY